VCINGMDWTKRIQVELYFFPHGWKEDDGLPTAVRCSVNST
jgi:hypothetical protein